MGSQAAKTNGSRNLAGIADPPVDSLIETIIAAKTREEITIAARALDRVLRAGRYWIPAWFTGEHFLAYWDMFERPGPIPARWFAHGCRHGDWWRDAAKAQRIGR